MKILIVGATSGIGRALAESYLREGHAVSVTGRRTKLLNEIRQLFPANCFWAYQDVRERELPYSSLISQMGGLDLFVYNAGYGDVREELDAALEEDTTATNVMGYVRAAAFAYDHFSKNGGGHFAQVSSVAASCGGSFAPAYHASKAYMSNYAQGLAMRAAREKKPIFITDIRPGFVATKMAKSDKLFWVVPVEKAVRQIRASIKAKSRVAYVSRRWRLIAVLVRSLPFSLLRRVG